MFPKQSSRFYPLESEARRSASGTGGCLRGCAPALTAGDADVSKESRGWQFPGT